ncbi:substrate-binding protein [Fodinicurvata halophila]|uniref:Substrate-binding protein n=1 Tax=Fodinicurvata halophila TaxID=1419723 RepID=A0ABV8UGP5_9PROT
MASRNISRRTTLKGMAATGAAATTSFGFPAILKASDTVHIGFLTALSGLETILGEIQQNCFELAVEEINNNGGAGGREVVFTVEDDQTQTQATIDKARQLIFRDDVDVIIGLIASLEHEAARTVTSPAQKLLIYTTYYEGEVCDPYYVATGQVPNQQIDPMVPWLVENVGKRCYIVGSDYVWPRTSAKYIQEAFERAGGEIIDTEFFPFGIQDLGPVFERINETQPDMVWSMLAGADGGTMLNQYNSFEMEPQLVGQGFDDVYAKSYPELIKGVIANQSYFMSLDTPANKEFLKKYRQKYGDDIPVNGIGESTYAATWLYAKAVAKADSTETDKVLAALPEVEFEAPQGHVNISAKNNHMRCNSILARAGDNGSFDIIEDFGQIDPEIPGCDLT